MLEYLQNNGYAVAAGVIIGLCALWFLLRAYKDLLLLVVRRGKLGTGSGRIWAIARTAMAEAWYAKAWVVPVIWLAVSVIITLLVRPYAEEERVGLDLTVLLRGQEYLLLVLLAVLACFSLPRERERRTIITTGSKPITRLELFLGKVVGFTAVGAVLLGVMGATTWGWMHVMDLRVRRDVAEKYRLAQLDYEAGKSSESPEGLRRVAEHGLLEARNFITGAGGMNIAGYLRYGKANEPPVRFLKGASTETLIYRFSTVWRDPQVMPFFEVVFPVFQLNEGSGPPSVEVQFEASLLRNPTLAAQQAGSITLRPIPGTGMMYGGRWTPRADSGVAMGGKSDLTVPIVNLFSINGTREDTSGPLQFTIKCMTPGVYLQVDEATDANQSNVLIRNLVVGSGLEAQAPMPHPKIVGFERSDGYQQIEGPNSETTVVPNFEGWSKDIADAYMGQVVLPQEVASWRFLGKDLKGVPINKADGTFSIAMYMTVEKQSNPSRQTYAVVRVYNDFTQNRAEIRVVPVSEKRLTEVRVPQALLAPDSDLYVDVRCAVPGHWIGVNATAVRLEQPSSWFALNLIKSELVVLGEVALLVMVAVTASIRLGGWVAMLATGVCYILGNLFAFIQDVALGQADSIFSPRDQRDLQGTVVYTLGEYLQTASAKVLYFLVHMLPDFRVFDPVGYIVESRNMPWAVLGTNLVLGLMYGLLAVAVGYLLIRKQEMA